MCLFLAWDGISGFWLDNRPQKKKFLLCRASWDFMNGRGGKYSQRLQCLGCTNSSRNLYVQQPWMVEVKIFSWVSGRHEWEMAGQVSNLDIRDDTDQAANLPFYLLQGDSKDFRNILLPVCGGTPFPDFSSATVTVCFFAPLLCQPELPISATRFYRTNTKNSLMSSHNPLCSKTRDVTETTCALHLDAGQKK